MSESRVRLSCLCCLLNAWATMAVFTMRSCRHGWQCLHSWNHNGQKPPPWFRECRHCCPHGSFHGDWLKNRTNGLINGSFSRPGRRRQRNFVHWRGRFGGGLYSVGREQCTKSHLNRLSGVQSRAVRIGSRSDGKRAAPCDPTTRPRCDTNHPISASQGSLMVHNDAYVKHSYHRQENDGGDYELRSPHHDQ